MTARKGTAGAGRKSETTKAKAAPKAKAEAPKAKAKGKAPTKRKAPAKRPVAAARRAPSGLLLKHERFCLEYVIDHNGTQAAIRAGYSPHTAGSQAFDLLKKPEIVARIAALEDEARRKLTIEHQDVLARYWEKATANPADLVQLRRVACRYCYGADHRYQWTTERELREAQDAALLATYPSEAIEAMADRLEAGERVPGVPTGEGGFGYNATALPNMACPECSGQGVASVHLADTREAINHPLFEGVKATQHGIEVKIGSRADALEKVARHLQFFNDKIQLGADEALLAAARAINQETPPVTPDYIAENSARLLDGDDT